MRIHHLNCGTMCPWGGVLMYGTDAKADDRKLVCHCILVETPYAGLVLVDTGFGLRDMQEAKSRVSAFFRLTNRIQHDPLQTARHQIEQLGFQASDVRHIVLTHLDFDHAGGIEDFPEATVHVFGEELQAAKARRGFVGRNRYRPEQWDSAVKWAVHGIGGSPWRGFGAVRDMPGLPPEILMIPLVGHTWGHCGVAIESDRGWVLHAGDAYFFRGEMEKDYSCPPGLRGYQRLMEVDRKARLHNQRRLRRLVASTSDAPSLYCSHDAQELARAQSESTATAMAQPRGVHAPKGPV
jgi:glyoxylase-like metal-dependent hydrolase (beta-lactamase superfamily II)